MTGSGRGWNRRIERVDLVNESASDLTRCVFVNWNERIIVTQGGRQRF
jgi:hypothetical protein